MFPLINKLITYGLVIANLLFAINGDEVSDLVQLINQEVADSQIFQYPLDNGDMYNDTSNAVQDFGQYCFIVVGAGSAGAIVARRLANYRFNVLLLEAGEEETDFTDMPGPMRNLQTSRFNWGYLTKEQSYACQGMINRQCAYPRGKALGGSSTINGVVYARSSQHDHDLWTTSGVTGWTWFDVLPYYIKLEDYIDFAGDFGYHGYSGPIHVELSTPNINFVDRFMAANQQLYQTTNDYNGWKKMGAGRTQYNKKDGKRVSTGRAYLTGAPSNLIISTKSYAYKVLIDSNKRAIGVEFMKNGIKYRARSKYEVILSGGSINTPQLLMLSGIGPQEELASHQIPLIKALPVGQNMEDHIGFVGLQFESTELLTNSAIPMEDHVRQYLQGYGRLTETALSSLVFLSTNGSLYPDIEVILLSLGRPITKPGNVFNLDSASSATFTPAADKIDYVFRMIVMLLHPKSSGSVTLKSSNPKDFPIIDPNSLSDPDDLERIYNAVEDYVKVILKADKFVEVNAKLLEQILPACQDLVYLSKEYWICTIKHMSHTIFHPVGTCRMGNNEVNSVVNWRLQVHGIKDLRVVDASVIPKAMSGHTNAPAMMIGERAADMIYVDNFIRSLLQTC